MNFGELRYEVAQRGFDYLLNDNSAETRLKRWVNLAYTEIVESDDWPFLRTTTTGTAPLTISDLGTVANCYNTTHEFVLAWRDERDLIDIFTDLSESGVARYFYFTSPTTIAVYPADTSSSLKVTYWKIPSELSVDTDEPAFPARYHHAIVSYAVAHAYLDNDNPSGAQIARAEGDRLVQMMRERLLVQQHANPDYIRYTGTGSDG